MASAEDTKDGSAAATATAASAASSAELDDYMRKKREGQMKSGGVYMPPHRIAALQRDVNDKKSRVFQRLQWDALRKSINGLINKVNTTNIKNIIPELFGENIVRGRGLLCRSILKAQMASPNFTHVYCALLAVLNTKMPEIGELLLKRVIMQFRRAFKRNDKLVCLACTKFLAHLVNQQIAHELCALQLVTLLLEKPTDDSVEVAVDFMKEVGAFLAETSPRGTHGIFERFRGILHEGEIDKRVQYMIEALFAVRKNQFADYPSIIPELDLVEMDDQITHELSLDDTHDIQQALNIFHHDPDWEENEKQYAEIKKEILGEESDDDATAAGGDAKDGDADADGMVEGGGDEKKSEEKIQITDATDADLVNLRRTIYLTIKSSVDFEECAHKLLKIKLKEGQEVELCNMLLECCCQENTYLRFYGLLGERFCALNPVYQEQFDECFGLQYATIHRYETGRLRNIAKFFGHLLYSNAIDWSCMTYIKLTEEDTTSSSRIFIKILFRELSELMGLQKFKERLEDRTMAGNFVGLFPKDHPKNTRFAINFFTSIGLGGLTEALREHLKNAPKLIMAQQNFEAAAAAAAAAAKSDSSSSSSSDSDSDSSSDSSSSSSSDSSSSDSDSDSNSKRKKSSSSSSSAKKKEKAPSSSSSADSKKDSKSSDRDRKSHDSSAAKAAKHPDRETPRDREREQVTGSRRSHSRDTGSARASGSRAHDNSAGSKSSAAPTTAAAPASTTDSSSKSTRKRSPSPPPKEGSSRSSRRDSRSPQRRSSPQRGKSRSRSRSRSRDRQRRSRDRSPKRQRR